MNRQTQEKPYSRIKWDTVRKKYGPRMLATMQELSAEVKRVSPQLNADDAWEMDADDYSVVICLKPKDAEPADVSFEIVESQDYEGVSGGYTFRLGIVAEGGRILGECAPYNYTEKVWCKTLAEIEERYLLVETAIKTTVVDYLADLVLT